jgi:hypothetical protein
MGKQHHKNCALRRKFNWHSHNILIFLQSNENKKGETISDDNINPSTTYSQCSAERIMTK